MSTIQELPGTALTPLPEPPEASLSYRQKVAAVRRFDIGFRTVRDTSGPVAKLTLGPRWLFPRGVMVSSPRGARDVLSARCESVDKGVVVHEQLRKLGGLNLFTMRNAEWKPRKRTIQPIFTKKHVATFAGHMADAAAHLCTEWVRTGQADLDAQSRWLTLRVLGRSVFGYDLGDRAAELGPHVRQLLTFVTRRSLRPFRAPVWLPTPALWRYRRAQAAVYAVIDEAIDRARNGVAGNAELIRQLLRARDPETGQGLSDDDIRDELMIFLLAGHDTTSTTITYALWALGKHPDLQDRVAAEARQLGDGPVTAADAARLPFTRQVLQESLRLCPPAAGVGRLTTADITVDGYRIEKGTNVFVGFTALHLDRELWGDDVAQFDPDRFSPERSAGRDRWCYLPFGRGPRGCIGEHFAMLEATIAVATIIRAVEIASVQDEFPTALPFTTVADGPISARIRARN